MAKITNQYNQVPHLTQDTTWESDKNTIKHHKQEPRGQPFPSRIPQGSNEQTRKHDKLKTYITQMIHKRRTALERSVKIFYWGALTVFTAPTSPLVRTWIKTHGCLVCMCKTPNLSMHHLLYRTYKSRYKKEIKQR